MHTYKVCFITCYYYQQYSIWPSLCVECFVRILGQPATFALYNINWLDFITVVESLLRGTDWVLK